MERVLIGDAPWSFLVEVAERAVFTYLLLMLAMRLMGRRVASQMDLSELALVLTLGASAGLPFQDPQKGVLPAVAILGTAIVFHRGLSYLCFRRNRVEHVVHGELCILVL